VRIKAGLNQIRAQAAAFKLAHAYGFRHPCEIDLEALAIDRGLKLKFGGISGCEARLVRIGKRGIVRIREQEIASPRCRFAISHELGHWELHPDTQSFICTANNLRDYEKDPKEIEANAFASELLMPTGLLRAFLEKRELTVETARNMADHFNVSMTAAAIRLCWEKRDESYLILSRNCRVEWASRHTDRSGVWVERGQALSNRSNAWHLCQHPERDVVSEVVEPGCWFPEFDDSDASLEVCEESCCLGATGYVLTILILVDD
jgi:IrrE N-terminal-like domain